MTDDREGPCRPTAVLLACVLPILFGLPAGARAAEPDPTLQERLLKEDVGALARAARAQGDPGRGAVVFYRPELACGRCHAAGAGGARLGPDLARAGKGATDVYLVESVLLPSKVISKGYE